MKSIIFKIILLITFVSNGQETKEVLNGVFVTFPCDTKYETNTKSTSYVGKSSSCFFMSIVQRNIIPNYHKYVVAKKGWSQSEIKKVEDSFLDNAVKGKLEYSGSRGNSIEVKIGKFNGRKIEYSAVNPLTGIRGKRFSLVLLVRDHMVFFDCWYLINSSIAKREKELFLKSIKVN